MAVKNFIPQIWSARLLEHLDKAHVYGNLVNKDYEGEIRNYGDTVKINQIGDIDIKDYTKGAIEDPDSLDGTQQTLTIDQAKYFNFSIEDVDNAQTNPKLMNDAMQRAAYGMNDVTDSFIANLMAVNAGNKIGDDTTPIVPTKEDAYDYLVDMGTALTEANVPLVGRWAVVPAWYHAFLLKDDRFIKGGTDYNKAIIEGGEIGTAAGFTVYLSNNVPNTAGAKYKILGGVNMATSFAEQLVKVEAYRPEKSFADAVKGLNVYGSKVLQKNALVCMTVNKK
jgi:hypothetical protein